MYLNRVLVSRSHLWDVLDATELWFVIGYVESFSLEGVLLHSLVVPGTDRVDIRAGLQLLEQLWCVVNAENLFDAIVMFSDIVLVFKDAKGSVDLVFVHFPFNNYKDNKLDLTL